MILTLLVLLSLCRIGSATGWIAVERRTEKFDHDLESTPLEIRTDSEVGTRDKVTVLFYTAQGDSGGVVILSFRSPWYSLSPCNSSVINFPTNLPSTRDKIWRITLTRTSGVRLVIHCNEVEVVNILLSDSTCSQSNWSTHWNRDVAKIALFGSAVDDYRPYKPPPAPCSVGDYMTDSGCQQCGENTFSGDGAFSCTSCPGGKISAAGSTSVDDCYYAPCSAGDYMTDSGCQQCGENTFSGDGAFFCTSCPDGLVSAAGSSFENDCGYVQYPTCDCWTPECDFCSNMECTVKQDLLNSREGIEVRSHLKWKKFNTIVLYDEDGQTLGKLQWSLTRLFLTSCVSCPVPPALKIASRGDHSAWAISLKDGVLQIKMNGQVLFEKKLSMECAGVYGRTSRFAFSDMSCENTFSFITNAMETGKRITPDCGGICADA